MDTITRKTEALALLALDTLTDEQKARLNILTAQQAGYRVLETPDGLRIQLAKVFGYDENGSSMHVYPLANAPEFCTSVDACLMLPLSPGQWWELTSDVVEAPTIHGYDCKATIKLEGLPEFARTLPLAMLRAFWTIQSD